MGRRLLPQVQDHDLRLRGKAGWCHGEASLRSYIAEPHLTQEWFQRVQVAGGQVGAIVHWDDQLRPQQTDHLGGGGRVDRAVTANGRQQDVDVVQRLRLFRRRDVAQVAQMANAQVFNSIKAVLRPRSSPCLSS